jgi:small-conductance mechanosensitive channel
MLCGKWILHSVWREANGVWCIAMLGAVVFLRRYKRNGFKRSPHGWPEWAKHWLFWLGAWSFATLNSSIFGFVCKSSAFNSRVLDAFFVLVPLSLGVFVVSFRSIVHQKEGYYYFFDARHNRSSKLQAEGGIFGPHSKRYNGLAKLVIALSAGAIAFLVNTLASNTSQRTGIIDAVRSTAPIVVGFFGFSIALLILFMAFQASWYEEYCHCEDHNSYNRWKYATCITLGWTGLVSFGVGFVWLAVNLFSPKR